MIEGEHLAERGRTQVALSGLLAGAAAGGLAVSVLWLYLSSITIDDGLEGLALLPIVVGVAALFGVLAGWKGMSWAWPCWFIAAMVVTVMAVGIIDRGERLDAAGWLFVGCVLSVPIAAGAAIAFLVGSSFAQRAPEARPPTNTTKNA
jgi:hypothetical protein